MRKMVLAAALLLAAVPARADMYQDASNAELPAAINKLFTKTPGSMDLTGGGWSLTNWWGNRGGQNVNWQIGSVAAPITTAGSPVAIGIVQGKTAATCDGNTANTGCNSALLLQNMGNAATTMVTSGLTSVAETQAVVGSGQGAAQAGNFVAISSPLSNGTGMGIYAVGIRAGASGSTTGAEISSWNQSDDCAATLTNFLSQCVGIWVAMRGPGAGPAKLSSAAIQVGRGNIFGKARDGLVFNQNTIDEKTISDYSSSITSLNIAGTHTTAIQTGLTAGRALFGTDASYNGPGAFAREYQFYSDTGMQIGRHSANAFSAGLSLTKSRHATVGSHTAVQNSDVLSQISTAGSDGTSYVTSGEIKTTVDGAVSAGIVPAHMSFFTMDQAGANAERLRLGPQGFLQISDNGFTVIDAGGSLLTLSAPRMIYVGDSLTYSGYNRYIDLSTYKDKIFSTQNIGIGGTTTVNWLSDAPDLLDKLYQPQSLTNIALIWLGTNDIALLGATPATVWANLQALAQARQLAGFRVCIGTVISRGAPPPGTWDTNLAALNGLITAGWAAAGINCLVDFGANPNLAPNGSNFDNTTYYGTDKTHLNGTGQALAASIAQTALNTYIGTLPVTPAPVIFPQLNVAGNLVVSGRSRPGAFGVSGAGLDVSGTFNDTTSSGTVANAYINLISPTLTASNATTVTNAISLRLTTPTISTNVTATTTYALLVAGTIASRAAAIPTTVLGTGISQISGTWTDTTSSGTKTTNTVNLLGAPTMAATNATTYTTATNLLVLAPVAGSNVTITNNWAAQFQGNIQATGAVSLTGLPTSAGGGGLAVCVDTAGVLYKKAACP